MPVTRSSLGEASNIFSVFERNVACLRSLSLDYKKALVVIEEPLKLSRRNSPWPRLLPGE